MRPAAKLWVKIFLPDEQKDLASNKNVKPSGWLHHKKSILHHYA
jgi:hypothetical protein